MPQGNALLRRVRNTRVARLRRVSSGTLVSWRTVFVGLFIAILLYTLLTLLGLSLNGHAVLMETQKNHMIKTLTDGAMVWIGMSSLVSLSMASYIASKSSRQTLQWIGGIQGLLISSLFFMLVFLWMNQIFILEKGEGGLPFSPIGLQINNTDSHKIARNAIENFLNDIPLKSEPTEIVQGLLTRLLYGDINSAQKYLSHQTSVPKIDLDEKLRLMESEVRLKLRSASANAAQSISSHAWKLFWILLFGTGVAILSGVAGTKSNAKRILESEKKLNNKNKAES